MCDFVLYKGVWECCDWKIGGRGRSPSTSPPSHGTKRLTPRCSFSKERRRYSFLLCEIIAKFMMIGRTIITIFEYLYFNNESIECVISFFIRECGSAVIGNGWEINYTLGVCLTFEYI